MHKQDIQKLAVLCFSQIEGLGHQELARPSQGDLALRDDSIRPQEEPVICPWSSKLMPPVGIQHSQELNRTCCLNGGTCMLGSFCACLPSFSGWNCEHDVRKKKYGSVPHDTWLPKKSSLCKCWHGQLRCFPQTFLPGCDGLVMDEHLMASRTPELPPSAPTPLMLTGICLSIESYYSLTLTYFQKYDFRYQANFMTSKGCCYNVLSEIQISFVSCLKIMNTFPKWSLAFPYRTNYFLPLCPTLRQKTTSFCKRKSAISPLCLSPVFLDTCNSTKVFLICSFKQLSYLFRLLKTNPNVDLRIQF
ncbi:teratocarcinoma-derived growth factor 1-like [Sapajus apella]|uniref:Teratocarcinoma-derived growth factor 1-like n=1 Tax=Sapajus apella TaxID=9515 RepID=A0A6J3I7P4_SAPAP|nr:teratocarcinoma-derived growth factor 1-like [Sapajus apella]